MAGEPSGSQGSPAPGSPAPAETAQARSPAASPPTASTSHPTAPLQVPGNVPLEADVFDDNSDGDSTWEHQSDTTSISSSIRQYRYENGRTYHSYKANEGVAYFLPNDDREVDRLDLQHAIMVMMQGNQLYLSPAGKEGKPLQRVLDIGTGSGIWAMEFGRSGVT